MCAACQLLQEENSKAIAEKDITVADALSDLRVSGAFFEFAWG
jgi:hypothetical protein